MNPYLLNVLDFGPKTLINMLDEIDPKRFDEAIDPERFTLRQAVAHLNDWEPIMRGRIETGVRSPGSAIVAYDEGGRAAEFKYDETNPLDQARAFLAQRTQTKDFVQRVESDQWGNKVVHPERGEMTVYDLVSMLIGHDMYHLEQVSRYLKEKTSGTW